MPAPPARLQLRFHKAALKEFSRLEGAAKQTFKNKLEKLVSRAEKPSPKHALHGFPPGYYKIKLRRAGLRLVYKYEAENLVILVVSVGMRERSIVYQVAKARLEGKL